MSKKSKDLTAALSNQISFLDNPEPEPGSLNIAPQLSAALSKAIAKSDKSRWQIAADMSELTGKDVTKTMLDAWTSEAHDQHRFPAEYLPAFSISTRNFDALKLLGRLSSCEVLESKEAVYAEIARIEKQKEELDRRVSQLKNMRH
jgi:hypothetical protein